MERNIKLGMLLAYYGSCLTERQQSILSRHVDDDLSLSEIAESEGISRQAVHDAIKRAEAQLQQMESSIGLVGKTQSTKTQLQQVQKGILAAHMQENEKARLLQQIARLQAIWEDDNGV